MILDIPTNTVIKNIITIFSIPKIYNVATGAVTPIACMDIFQYFVIIIVMIVFVI
jgi:hypothetical protein